MLQTLEKITSLKAPKVKMPYFVAYTAALISQTAFSFIGKTPPIPLDGVKMARKYMFFDSNKAQEKVEGLHLECPNVSSSHGLYFF